MTSRPTPEGLWQQACDEHGQGTDAQRQRYGELLLEHDMLVPRKPGDDDSLPCGW